MVWERFSSTSLHPQGTRRKKTATGNDKQRGTGSGRAVSAPTSIRLRIPSSTPTVTVSGSFSRNDELCSSMSGTESILSGELGDSESSPSVPKIRTRRSSEKLAPKAKEGAGPRRVTIRRVEQRGSSAPPDSWFIAKRKRRSCGRRKIKLNLRFTKEAEGRDKEEDEALKLNQTLEVPVFRGPLLPIPGSSTETEESTSQSTEERESTDSEEYETELETRFPTPPMLALDTTGRTGYLITCKKLSVSPCSIFLRHAMEDKLKLKYYGLRPRDTRALAMGFRDNTFITNVDLSYNCIGTEGIIYIGRALRENQHISDINLSFCFLGKETTGAMAIWSLIKASHNINRLNISHNCFNGKDYIWLARTLQLKSRLYALDISDNEFGFFGVSEFVEALEENDILEELIMDWNPLMCRGSAAVLNSVAKNMNLKQLGLAHTGVGSITVPAVEHLLMKNDFLQSLDLRRNHLTLDSQRAIHLAMEVSKTNMTVQL